MPYLKVSPNVKIPKTRPWVIALPYNMRVIGTFPTEMAAKATLAEMKVWTKEFDMAEVIQLESKRILMRQYKQHGLVTV
jgi:hypothetical protein